MQSLKIKILEDVPGYYSMHFKLNSESKYIYFSDKYPPILQLFAWLKTIAKGEENSTVLLNLHSLQMWFGFSRISQESCILTIFENIEKKKIFLQSEIITVDLVKSFYNAILAFVEDDAFMDYNYSRVTPGKRLYNKLKLIRPRLIEQLLKLDRNSIQNLIYSVDPVYKNTVSSKIKSNNSPKLMSSFPLITNEYDSMTNEQKALYLHNYLKTGHNYVKMTNKPNFESEAIQQYLDNHRK